MILTCPECATSYFVDDSRIPEAGRTVKCTSCGARWTASRENALAEAAEEARQTEAAGAPDPAGVEDSPAAAAAEIPIEDDLEFVPAEPPPRARASARRPGPSKADAGGKVAVWASAAVLTVALVGGAIGFRGEVVRMWPKSQAAYAGLGLPVNSVGLVIEGVHAEPTFAAGRPVLSITGAIRNVKGEAVDAPPLRVNLLNHSGQAVAAKVARPIDPRVPAGGVRHFAIAISDPPANAKELEVVFDAGPQRAAATPISPPAAPAPVDAQPLPPGSPDALPEHG